MNRFKTLLAGVAALLVVAQPAFAAPRTAAGVAESEELAGYPGSGPVIAVIGVVALISLIMLVDGGDNDQPASP